MNAPWAVPAAGGGAVRGGQEGRVGLVFLVCTVVGGLAAAAPPPQQPAAPPEQVAGLVARFYRTDRTLVNGFVRVPHGMLSAVTPGPAGSAAYTVALRVTDQGGTELVRDQWTRQVPWAATQVRGAESVEPFAFTLAPGRYDVQIEVRDSASGRRQQVAVPVTGFAARPGASDLLLAYWIRQATGPGDTVPAAGEFRKGDLFLASAPELTLVPSHPAVAYYCEVYRDSGGPVPWQVQVRGADGRAVVTTAPAQTTLGAGGGPIAASVDLTGLPPGDYTLAMVVGAGADTLTRTAAFHMAGFETERALQDVAQQQTVEPSDVFTTATEDLLDSLFAPLVYVGQSEELSVYKGLSLEGKRRFLRAFWRRRDPTPGTPANEERVGFYARIATANERFREGGASQIPGWRTDRGRVFIKYGDPDLTLHRPEAGPDRPWEAWKYTTRRQLKFVFLDQTRLGNYSLIYTTDRLERNPGDWEHLLSQDAIREINSF